MARGLNLKMKSINISEELIQTVSKSVIYQWLYVSWAPHMPQYISVLLNQFRYKPSLLLYYHLM